MAWYGYGGFPRYVPVAERCAKAQRQVQKLAKQGKTIEPVKIEGRIIAASFWGKGWCEHLESFSDFSNRLPRGRSYVLNGSVCHLSIRPGRLEALVSGTRLYTVNIRVSRLKPQRWRAIRDRCAGRVGSMLELLQGKLSDQVMTVVTDRAAGLFPQPGEIKLDCSCPDWATMCKHVAAVLYGVGSRLDERPELLFTLRGVDPQELIAAELALPDPDDADSPALADDQLSEVFGIDLDDSAAAGTGSATAATQSTPRSRSTSRRTAKARPAGRSCGSAPRGSERSARRNGRTARAAGLNAAAKNHADDTRTPNIRPTGKSVARLRRRSGLSQAAFARQVGVSAASVRRWESTAGRLSLHPSSLEALADLQRQIGRQ